MKKIGNLIVFIFLFFQLTDAWSANVKVEASVDRAQLGIGDSLVLNIAVSSDEDFELEEPQLPKIQNLEVISSSPGGRQSSSSMSIVNGKTQFVQRTAQDYNIILSPQKEGSYVIPRLTVKVGQQTYQTDPIKIDVSEEYRNARAKPKGRPRFPPGFGGQVDDEESLGNAMGAMPDTEDIFDQLLRQQQKLFGGGGGQFGNNSQLNNQIASKKLNVNTNEAFFVYLDVDKTEVYEGEQITANWYIYTRSNIESLDRAKFPDLKGFWKEIIEEVPSLQFVEEIVNGVRYRKALLASHALFPIKAGVSVIDEFKIKAKVRMPTPMGWGQSHEFTKASRRTEIKVLPLPQEGRTQSFSGAVGNYKISLKTEGNSFPVNQPFSIKVSFEGMGNAKLIDLPVINWPAGLEIYDTKSDSKFFKEGHSYKEFEILAIPRKEGEMKISSLNLTYFDPKLKKYVSQATEDLVLQITAGVKGATINSGSKNTEAKSDVVYKPQSILQLPQATFAFENYRGIFYMSILVIGILAIFSYFIGQYKKINFETEFASSVNLKLNLIEKNRSLNEIRKVGSEATNLIYILVANLAGQKKADQEIHLLINEISSKNQQQFLSQIIQLFDYFQLLGFSPDEVMQTALRNKPLEKQVGELNILAKEIVAKLKKQDNYNA